MKLYFLFISPSILFVSYDIIFYSILYLSTIHMYFMHLSIYTFDYFILGNFGYISPLDSIRFMFPLLYKILKKIKFIIL